VEYVAEIPVFASVSQNGCNWVRGGEKKWLRVGELGEKWSGKGRIFVKSGQVSWLVFFIEVTI